MKLCWVTINVEDIEESLFFYQEIVGLKISRRFKPDPDREIVFLGNGETKVELIYNSKKKNISFGEDISLGFEVNSIEEISKKLEKNNIEIHAGPFQPNPSLRFIFIVDPNGLKIQFVENR